MLIIAGMVLRPYGIANFMSVTALVVIIVVGYCLLGGFYYITAKVSELTRKNQELAIQVSLINQENQIMTEKLEKLIYIYKTIGMWLVIIGAIVIFLSTFIFANRLKC